MNSSGWDKFGKQQATEREQLSRLLSGIQGLLAKSRDTTPNEIELSALAATLHSFYTGVENIFKRVAVELDGEPVRGEAGHRQLLLRMKSPAANRPALISEELHNRLNEYLRFRHVFRNAYSFDLDWQKMAPLVLGLEQYLGIWKENWIIS
ncbi:MAG TPA: hypothetical protein VGO67_24120 [Verrucomicrobiae bacterium]|jgi:hypothetical protein